MFVLMLPRLASNSPAFDRLPVMWSQVWNFLVVASGCSQKVLEFGVFWILNFSINVIQLALVLQAENQSLESLTGLR